jgi:hypothetical protein
MRMFIHFHDQRGCLSNEIHDELLNRAGDGKTAPLSLATAQFAVVVLALFVSGWPTFS